MWEFRSTLRTDGVPAPIVRSMAHDVTERVEAERALRVSEDRLAAAFRASPCSIAISTMEDGRVIEINDACQQHTGYHRSESSVEPPRSSDSGSTLPNADIVTASKNMGRW
jgi:PAS domain-containing protein